MAVRKKSRLERLLSFNQHRKRFGAGKITKNLPDQNLAQLKQQTISGNEVAYTHGAEKNIEQHLQNLRAEFAGGSELLHYHASLIVMIRREYAIKANIARFEQLWAQEQDYLQKHLNMRWLVSAADTFADHARDPLVRAMMLNVAVLFNTVKMQETERFLQNAETLSDMPERHKQLASGRVDLMDGTSAFAVGTDDTLRNMRWRINEIAQLHPLGGLLTEVFQRLQTEDSVYRRFRERHTRSKTAWW